MLVITTYLLLLNTALKLKSQCTVSRLETGSCQLLIIYSQLSNLARIRAGVETNMKPMIIRRASIVTAVLTVRKSVPSIRSSSV